MTKFKLRVRVLLAVFFVLVIAGLFLWQDRRPRPPYGVTERSFTAIHKGMTRTEVEAVIGGPPGLYDVEIMIGYDTWPGTGDAAPGFKSESWAGPQRVIRVVFDQRGIVANKELVHRYVVEPSIWDRLIKLFGM